jgi:hypothetical protein
VHGSVLFGFNVFEFLDECWRFIYEDFTRGLGNAKFVDGLDGVVTLIVSSRLCDGQTDGSIFQVLKSGSKEDAKL